MRQVWHPYWDWEDFKAGMWRKATKTDENRMLQEAIDFTGDHVLYGRAMLRVIDEWPVTMEHNLTDLNINQKAFVGHCAVCLELGIPEYIVRMAWVKLEPHQQVLANLAAENAIHEWKCKYSGAKKCKGCQLELTF